MPEAHLVGLATVIAAFLQAGVLVWQIVYLKRALGHSKDATKIQLRAYVSITQVEFRWSSAQKNNWRADFAYRNTGGTPAYNVVVYYNMIESEPDPSTVDFTAIGERWRIGLIGANGDDFWDWAYFTDAQRRLKDRLTNDLKSGQRAVYLFGRITYDDQFGEKRWTSFRYMVGGDLGFDDEFMTACEEGNETEESERLRKGY